MTDEPKPRPNLEVAADVLEGLLVYVQTAQACEEANPIRLEAVRLVLLDQRAILRDLIEGEAP